MRTIITIITILLFTACSNTEPKPNHETMNKSETKEMKSLKKALSIYTQATINNDSETLVTFIYPKAFTVVPKKEILKMLKRTFASGKVPKIENVKHIKIEKVQKFDDGLYSIITSSMNTIIKSPRPDDLEFEEDRLKKLQKRLSSRGKVTLDKERHLFNIQHTNKTIAVNEDGSWKFIGFKQAEKYISNGIFPLTLIEKLN